MITESASAKIDTPAGNVEVEEAETDEEVIESGTENEGLGATPDEMTIEHHDGIGIFSMIGGEAVEDVEAEEIEMEALGEDLAEESSAQRAQVLHLRRRNPHQI